MRKILLIIGLVISIGVSAQVEYLYDFNSLSTGQRNLDGQDGWVTHYQTAASSQDFDVDYVCGSDMSPDETIAIWYPYGGSGVGRTATRKASPNFNFSFQDGGIMDLEMDMLRTWWGNFFGVGFDGDGDGHILPGMNDVDGGVYLFCKGLELEAYGRMYDSGYLARCKDGAHEWRRYAKMPLKDRLKLYQKKS